MRAKRWIILSAAALSLALVVWVVLSLQNDDSTLSVIARYVRQTVCWSADSSLACAVKAMGKYEKKGRYEDAIRIGTKWADKYPDSITSGFIDEDVSALYLKKAGGDNGNAEEYIRQALVYRDKALRFASDSPYYLPNTRDHLRGGRGSFHGPAVRSIRKCNQASRSNELACKS